MTPAPIDNDPIDIPEGAYIKRPDYARPYVTMSSRYRWSICALSAILPQLRTPSGPAADEGTEAHKVAEWALAQKFKIGPQGTPAPAVQPPPGLIDFDYNARGIADWQAQVAQHAITYANEAAGLYSDVGGDTHCLIECVLDTADLCGVKVACRADLVLWNPQAKRLVVGDYKYGRSPVGVGTADEPNEQCAGAAVLWSLDKPHLQVEQLGLFVYQPRIRLGDAFQTMVAPDASAWLALQKSTLEYELEHVAAASAAAARGELVDPVPGEHCKYCPSARWCPAAAAFGAKALDVEANKVAVIDLTPEEVMAQWSMRSAFKQYEEDLKERVRILHEKQHPAVTVKFRKGSPMWLSAPAAVEAFLMADRMDLLQPPAIGKAAGIIPDSELAALTGRYPDVATFTATDGKNPGLAAGSFAKYLNQEQK